MKQWKQRIACLLAGIMVITGFFPWNSPVSVHAEESVIKSSADGFEYRPLGWVTTDYICTSNTTQIYDNYKDAIKGLADISRKILVERKAESFSIKIPVEIKADQKVSDIEKGSNPFNDAVRDETYKETGNPEEGQGLAQFLYARGNLMNDKLDKITYDEDTKSYKGVFYYHSLSYKYSERYSKTITKLNEIMESLTLDGKSDYEKCIAIRKWIAKNVKYDDEFFKNAESCPRKNAHDMTGAVLDGYAVCDGYAYLFHYMANAAGLLTLVEHGVLKGSGNHAWNLVQIDGTFYYTDCTGGISLDKNGEPTAEFLYGQDYMFKLSVTPKNNDIEDAYSNISKDDWSKDHSVCQGNHTLVKSGQAPATCEEMGYMAYHCTNSGCIYICRDYNIEPLGHNYDYTNGEITQSQDCTHPEITTYRCTRCKAPEDRETKPSLGGHRYEVKETTLEPTCTEEGKQTLVCTVCGQETTKTLEPLKHNFEITTNKAPTCTSNGSDKYTCKRCGYFMYHTVEATGHKEEIRNKKEATCSSTGYTGDTYCSVCNKKLSSGETIAKKEHTWVKQDNIPATCEKGEMEVEKCSVCGETKETQVSDPLGHDFEEWKITKDPICTKNGTKKRICKRCKEYEIDVIDPTGHQHTKIIDQKEATCEEKGYTGDIYCNDCRRIVELGKDIAPTGHTMDEGTITKEPTQTATGIKEYKCKTCKKVLKTETIPMLKSHHWDQGTQNKAPTCTEAGEMIYHCTDEDCDETYTEVIDPTGHQHTKIIDQKDATCEENGYSGDTYCEDCKQTIKTGKVIKATGHDWYDKNMKLAATCEADGIMEKACHNCNATKEEPIKATGHKKTEIRNKKDATCEQEGYTGDIYCVTCEKRLEEGKVIPKTDHTWTITETKATCEHDGMKTYTCEICGMTKSEPIKASGHDFGAWTTTKEATVSSKEEQKRTCSICKKTETRGIGDKLKATIRTNAASLKLKKKQSTMKFTITGLAKGDYVTSITSSNNKIVNVTGNKNGTCKIKAGSKTGKATITIKLASGLTKQIKITVQKKAVTCTKIKNVPKTIRLNKKQTYQLKPMIEPITCTDKAKYKSSNKKTAKVTKSGKITAVKKGKTKVTVAVGKKKFVCTVNVR